MMTKEEIDDIEAWWIITSWKTPKGPYFSKKSDTVDEYKGIDLYDVTGALRGDFHGWELKEIEATELTKALADIGKLSIGTQNVSGGSVGIMIGGEQ